MKRMYLLWVLLLGFGFVYQISTVNAQIVRDELTIKFKKKLYNGKTVEISESEIINDNGYQSCDAEEFERIEVSGKQSTVTVKVIDENGQIEYNQEKLVNGKTIFMKKYFKNKGMNKWIIQILKDGHLILECSYEIISCT
ncbi:MAG: hypothetical protein ACOYND_09940 [Bacteroidota bacterium]